jgi:hypothetical protein
MEATNVVLVHGAWSDGSSWSKVIPPLQSKSFNVTAVQLPLRSLEDDIAITRRILTMQKGATILVSHSYEGAVITGAGNDAQTLRPWFISRLSALTQAKVSMRSASRE